MTWFEVVSIHNLLFAYLKNPKKHGSVWPRSNKIMKMFKTRYGSLIKELYIIDKIGVKWKEKKGRNQLVI